MKRMATIVFAACALAACTSSASRSELGLPPMSPAALMPHIEELSSDAYEGRAPSSAGEALTLAYLEREFSALGLTPGAVGADGAPSWRQGVPLVSAAVQGAPQLAITGSDGARAYAFGEHFVAWSKRAESHIAIDNAPLVFVGYGVVAPERAWNDYAGVDMRGKVAVILVNDPDFETGVDGGFGGRAMTYYGRWTYKFEEAARHGAAGALIIHETEPAAYPWAVVQSSWTNAQFDVVRDDGGQGRVAVEGWVTREVGEEMFARAGLDFGAQKARAQRPGFTPVAMGPLSASIAFDVARAQSVSANFVAVLPGRERPQEAVIYGAHWDHLGHCAPVDGDGICNGARDNATGIAGLIELARAHAAAGPAQRSLVFIAFTAEESGLLGSAYYADHPSFTPATIVANINMDSLSTIGRAHDFTITGYGKSEMDDLAEAAARAQGRRVTPDPHPERGHFFRSDQFNFARRGVPVLDGGSGVDLIEGGEARGRALGDDYLEHRYHKPQDEISPDWDLAGASEDLALFYAVGRRLADSQSWPQWRADAEFRAAREASKARQD